MKALVVLLAVVAIGSAQTTKTEVKIIVKPPEIVACQGIIPACSNSILSQHAGTSEILDYIKKNGLIFTQSSGVTDSKGNRCRYMEPPKCSTGVKPKCPQQCTP